MKLLVDTDAFCKLGVAALLDDAVGILNVVRSDCGRLSALPYMLRRGTLVQHYGAITCSALAPLADDMAAIPRAKDATLEPLVAIDAIDPGEAQLFAVAKELDLMILSGDKRALHALKHVPDFSRALSGRIVVLETVLLALLEKLGTDILRRRVAPLIPRDVMAKSCFSSHSVNPSECLHSYYRHLAKGVHPLRLWAPPLKTRP